MAGFGLGSYLGSFGSTLPGTGQEKNNWIIGSSVVLIPVAIICIALRIFWRTKTKAFGWDDAYIILVAICLIALLIFSVLGSRHGIGSHIWVLMNMDAVQSQDTLYLAKVITWDLYGSFLTYTGAMTATRLSVIACYFRIFSVGSGSGKLRMQLRILAVASGLMFVASVFVLVFMCIPVNSTWNWYEKRKTCIDIQGFFYAAGVINTVTDLLIWALPLKKLWNIHVSKSKRTQLTVLFGFGGFGIVCSILRLFRLQGLQTADITFTCVMPVAWSVIEASVTAICACIPPSKPLYTFVRNKLDVMGTHIQRAITGLWGVLTAFLCHTFLSLWPPVARRRNTWPQPRDVKSDAELDHLATHGVVRFRYLPWAHSVTVSSLGSFHNNELDLEVGFV